MAIPHIQQVLLNRVMSVGMATLRTREDKDTAILLAKYKVIEIKQVAMAGEMCCVAVKPTHVKETVDTLKSVGYYYSY